MRKRILAGILAALMMTEVVICPTEQSIVYAAAIENESVSVESTEGMLDAEAVDGTENLESVSSTENIEGIESTELTEEPESTESDENTEAVELPEETEEAEETEEIEEAEQTEEMEEETEEIEEETEETEETEEPEDERYYIQYLVLDSEVISLNQTQRVVLGLDCEKEIEYASLQYHNKDTGESFTQTSTDVTDGAILFEIAFQNAGQAGAYQLDAVTYVVEGKSYTENLVVAGIEAVFGMEQEVDSNPDAIIEDSASNENMAGTDIEMDIVQIDSEGNVTSQNSIEEAIDNANADKPAEASVYSARTVANDIVVVLDPGHDSTHAGAQANNLQEETLNLKIALYCKEELEQYNGVKVYLTRSADGSCPYPGTTSGVCNENRVNYAASVGADIFISLHNNSATNTSAHGAMVFYPNSNYNAAAGQVGKNLAQTIENHLVALGLYNRGITIKDAQQDKYPDGSTADYYGVIRNCKLAGIPAIIVEHAFVSNSGDANNYLSTDEKLKQLGVADATAVAEYYGLSKGVTVTSDSVQISNLNNAAGVATMSVTAVSPDDKIRAVSFAVWSKADQSDLYWYHADKIGVGGYSTTLRLSNHNYNQGVYYVDAFAEDIYGVSHALGRASCSFQVTGGAVTVQPISAGQYSVTLSGMTIPGGTAGVSFAIWGEADGQNDLRCYNATQNSDGTWSVVLPIANHGEAGVYNIWAYGVNMGMTSTCVVKTAFRHEESASVQSIEIKNLNSNAGIFDVYIKGVSATCGVKTVQVPVWSKEDQSDIKWYTAALQSDGSYAIQVNVQDHDYNYGEYTVHVYVKSTTQIKTFVGATSVTVNQPQAKVQAVLSSDEKTCSLTASNVAVSGGIQKAYFAVWSEAGGQDDLLWYEAEKNADGTWQKDISIAAHKTEGTYQVHLYGENRKGERSVLGATSFTVNYVGVQSIKVKNLNAANGTFDVFISGIESPSGVSSVQVPVWSKGDQSDIRWYTAAKQSDGSYAVQINIRDYNYTYGKYTIHTYVTAGNGVKKFVGSTSTAIYPPQAKVQAALAADEKSCSLSASSVQMAGGVQKVYFAVWSETGGQDDLLWYEAEKSASGIWQKDISIAAHKTEGTYQVHLYGEDITGKRTVLGTTTFDVSYISVQTIRVKNVMEGTGTFDVFLYGIESPSGATKVQVPVWSREDQSDIRWYTATKQSDGSYAVQINIQNHNYNYGKYTIHTYVTAGNGVCKFTGSTSVTMNLPQTKVQVGILPDGQTCNLIASDVGLSGGVKKAYFAVWSEAGGQDDLQWYEAGNTSSGVWQQSFALANHRTAGVYEADVYAIDCNNNYVPMASIKFTVQGPSASSVSLVNYNETDGTFGVRVEGASSPAGVASVKVAVWSSGNQADLLWYDATPNSDGSYVIGADVRNHSNNTGLYYADAYVYDNNGISICAGRVTCSIVNVTNILHPISGSTSVTVQQMTAYYNRHASYPSFYQNTEAPTIEAFCQIYIEECRAEGIKAEVAFCQAMKETGFLKYGGNVKIEQYNFAGMGSTGAGVQGESFPDVRTGIRAQVQHLKAYANNEALNNACVDNRFRYVTRGTAPYVEWLGIQENPYGKGWATAKNYGYQIVSMVNNLKQY
ncbi:MAG: GBS Bsp-like repeat-containing protein [Roseburia sp.]|nr:GBS Bsp-like repeat-containing protein [Roseburia sp.]